MKAFKSRLQDLFEGIEREAEATFKGARHGAQMTTSNGFTVTERDGHIEIAGPMRSLTVNGRLVRFKE